MEKEKILQPFKNSKSDASPAFLTTAIFWGIPLILAVVIGLFTIDGEFVQDDYAAIRKNPIVTQGLSLQEAFLRDFWGTPVDGKISIWRPLLPMIWRILWRIKPDSPFLYRLLSLLFHVAATASLLYVGQKLINNKEILWTSGILFAVHAVHSEAVGGIVSQADILSTVLGLLAVSFVLGDLNIKRSPLVTVLLTLACLAKETAVIFGVVLFIIVAVRENLSRKQRLYTLIPIFTVTISITIIQLFLERKEAGGGLDNLARDAQGVERILYGFHLIGKGISMCFIPIGLAPNHGYASVDLQWTTLLPYALPGFLFLTTGIVGLGLAIRSRNLAWIIGLCLLFGPVMIQSNLIVIITTDLAERLLYTSSVASCVIMAAFLHLFFNPPVRRTLTVLATMLLLLQSWHVQRPWHSQLTLFRYATEAEPLSWRARHHYGVSLLVNKQFSEGIWYYMTGLWIDSQYHHETKKNQFLPILWMEDHYPLPQRILEAPSVLYPTDPCRFAAALVYDMHDQFPASAKALLTYYSRNYGDCVEREFKRLEGERPLKRHNGKSQESSGDKNDSSD